MKHISINNKKIFFTDDGHGEVLVLLHGFTESMDIWKRFGKKLSRNFRVITIDLPGHGASDVLSPVHSMELLADVVKGVLKNQGIRKCTMIGHSMGGYVTLAFAARYPSMLKKLGLFHSHPFPDTPEEKKNRERAVSVIDQNKSSYLMNFIPDLFAEENRKIFHEEILVLIEKANQMTREGVVASQLGMKDRVDQCDLLRNLNIPVMLIIGLKDTRFPHERLTEMITLAKRTHCLILRDAGHMGYLEDEKSTMDFVENFLRC
ncbi:MAG: alpha/beta fold hydrolase [Syntrophothermus sp.]